MSTFKLVTAIRISGPWRSMFHVIRPDLSDGKWHELKTAFDCAATMKNTRFAIGVSRHKTPEEELAFLKEIRRRMEARCSTAQAR